MSRETLEQIRRQADADRANTRIDLSYYVRAAEDFGPLTWRDLAELALWDRTSDVGRPLFLLDFVAELTSAFAPRSILDPCVTAPTLIAAAQDAAQSGHAYGLVEDTRLYEIARSLCAVHWLNGDPFYPIDDIGGEPFDLVLVAPPVGVPIRLSGGGSESATVPPASQLADLVLWRAGELVSPSGHILAHTTDDFFSMPSRRRVLAALGERGINMSAVISVDGGFSPRSSISTSLILLDAHPSQHLFVGRLDHLTAIPQLVSNLREGRASQDPKLGSVTERASFRGWQNLSAERELSQLFGSREMVAMNDLGAVKLVTLKPDVPYDPEPNSVFVPTLGFGAVSTSPPSLAGKKSYKVLVLQADPAIARAEYLAALLSSPVGKRLRESAAVGTSIPHLSLTGLRALRIPMPPVRVQDQAIRATTQLNSMEAEVARLRSELFRKPESANHVLLRLEAQAKSDPVLRWIDTLPYPLASVLQRYTSRNDAEQQVEALQHFLRP
jgi:hypothetical protein